MALHLHRSRESIDTMVAKMLERRYQRFPVSMSGTIFGQGNGPNLIRSVDLSQHGCRIENTLHVDPGTNVGLFLIPRGECLPILIHDATVRWCGADGIGIEFHTVADYHRGRLDLLLKQLKKPN